MRNAARAAVIAVGAIYAWQWRFYVNPDAVAYFDVADTLLQRGWFAAISTHRSPLFPLLLAIANHVPPYWESSVAHGVAFLMYAAAFAALEFFLWSAAATPPLYFIAYALFLWACNFAPESGPALLTPDLLVAAAIFLGSALVVRIANGSRGWRTFIALGATLGFGYLSKEAMLPIGAFFLAAAAIAGGRRAWPRIAVAGALFAILASLYIVPLSMKLGRFSTGETSRYNLIFWVDAEGKPIHKRPAIFRDPLIVAYPDGAGRGTYAVHDDLRYWLEGMRPRFNLGAELRRIGESFGDYGDILRSPLHLALLVIVLVLLFTTGVKPLWIVVLPSLAVLAMYALVFVQPRYVAPSIVVLWLGLFAGAGAEPLRVTVRAAAIAVLVALAASRDTWSELQPLVERPTHENWLVAQQLAQSGVRAGDRVGVVNPPYMCYWARLARVRIAAEVMEPQKFWAADEATQEAAERALQHAGIRALVAEDAPENDAPCFESVDETSYSVCVLHAE